MSFTIPPSRKSSLPPPLPPRNLMTSPVLWAVRPGVTTSKPPFPGCSFVEIECNETYEEHPESDLFDLSIVIAGRNDEYGGANGTGGSLQRFQSSLHWMNFHLERLGRNVSIEMIVVDWNPLSNRPPLSAVVFKPPSIASMRFITVPSSLHQALASIYGRKPGFRSFDSFLKLL